MTLSRLTCLTAALAVLSACGETPTAPGSLDPQFDRVASKKSAKSVKMVDFDVHHLQAAADASDVVCPAGNIPFKSIGEGSGDPIGDFTLVTIACLHGPTLTYSRIETTMTTRHGDELYIEMDLDNPARLVFPNGPPAFEVIAGQHIVGGTGKFEGATGYVTGHLVGTLGVDGASVTTTGEISKPGKSAKSKKSKKSKKGDNG